MTSPSWQDYDCRGKVCVLFCSVFWGSKVLSYERVTASEWLKVHESVCVRVSVWRRSDTLTWHQPCETFSLFVHTGQDLFDCFFFFSVFKSSTWSMKSFLFVCLFWIIQPSLNVYGRQCGCVKSFSLWQEEENEKRKKKDTQVPLFVSGGICSIYLRTKN